jgi:hypothetical protein
MTKPPCFEDRGKFVKAAEIIPGGKSPCVTDPGYECPLIEDSYLDRLK